MSEEIKPVVPPAPAPAKPAAPVKLDASGRPLKTATPINVVKVESIKLPTWTGKDVEDTGMSDTADQYLPGVPNYGEGEIDVMYLATQNASIKALRNLAATFVVTYPNGQIDTWTGWINSFGVEIKVKDKIEVKIKVRANSDVVSTGIGTTLTITAS
jgi:hypothetical protein